MAAEPAGFTDPYTESQPIFGSAHCCAYSVSDGVPATLRLGLVENLRRLADQMLAAWDEHRRAEAWTAPMIGTPADEGQAAPRRWRRRTAEDRRSIWLCLYECSWPLTPANDAQPRRVEGLANRGFSANPVRSPAPAT